MIGANELAALQATANSALDLSIQVKRPAKTSDGQGGFTETFNNVGSPIKGNLAQPTGGQMQNYGYIIGPLATWMVRVPVGTNLQINDRLVVAGQTLRVQVLLQPQSYQTAERVLASEVGAGEVD